MALYRKYRPATFAEVVGQEQVTAPLSAALDSGRINHAYLFSGPRGCGKTSSARIMARSLNCAQGPTSQPCGTCPSCVSLAPGGPGNLDVTELDAASHNGVDDMRELRDRAYYAPAESRYRIFIIDEAHMISQSGANALLKVVEEPPEHVIFIFATTEPEKIIGTIRSRTHHYPFRLLTPPAMKGLLQRTVASENVHVDDAVYPMVIQAGGGSPRDTLSILDQLLAGAGPDGLTYELARPLLGVTDLTLIDDTIAALAAGDKAGLFKLVDDVIEAGHEPRRFAVDLLDRLRDLMVLQAVPDACEAGLVDAPTDRASVLAQQAQSFSGQHLAFLAAKVNEQVAQLRGATSPRLLLEILCANLVSAAAPVQENQPSFEAPRHGASGQSASAPAAQSERSSRSGQSGAAAAAAAIANRRRNAQQAKPEQSQPTQPAQAAQRTQPAEATQPAEPAQQAQPSQPYPAQKAEQPQSDSAQRAPESAPAPGQSAPSQPEEQQEVAKPQASPEELTEKIRSEWAAIRVAVGKKRKPAEIMLTEARVLGIKDGTLVLGHTTGALAERLNADDNNSAIVEALKERLEIELAVNCIIGTDPEKAGFAAPAGPRPTWNPQKESAQESAHDEPESDEQEPESPAPNQQEQPAPRDQGAQRDQPAQAEGTEGRAPEQSQGDVYSGPAEDEQPRSQHEVQQEANPEVETPEGAAAESETQPAAQRAPESSPAPKASNGGWGAPRPIGGENPQPAREQRDEVNRQPQEQPAHRSFGGAARPAPTQPSPRASQPAQPPQRPGRPSWQDKIAQVTQLTAQREEEFNKNAFSNGVPLPPEPEDDYPPAPPEEDNYYPPRQQHQAPAQQAGRANNQTAARQEPAQPYSRDDEEREMIEAAQEAGEHDHRSSTEVAMELLEKELGARRA